MLRAWGLSFWLVRAAEREEIAILRARAAARW